jgi:choline dehydrogenase-like flavoprotein
MFLHSRKKDRFGIPQVATEFQWSNNEREAVSDSALQAGRILRAAGAVGINVADGAKLDVGGDAIHEMGTARMGADPATSVLNADNRAHEIDNLYVTDGSFMASSSCVNPSLTYMAFTARACDHAASRLRADELT